MEYQIKNKKVRELALGREIVHEALASFSPGDGILISLLKIYLVKKGKKKSLKQWDLIGKEYSWVFDQRAAYNLQKNSIIRDEEENESIEKVSNMPN